MARQFKSFSDLMFAVAKDVKASISESSKFLDNVGIIVKEQAQEKIGYYQDPSGPFTEWVELSDRTKIERLESGWTANDPLLRSGTLKNSITYTVLGGHVIIGVKSGPGHDGHGDIGDIAVDQEFGTFEFGKRHIPPRPFMGPALFETRDQITDAIRDGIIAELRLRI